MLFFHFLFVLSNEACSLMLILQIFSLFFSLFYSALSSWRHVKRHPLSKMLHKNQTTDWTRKILKIKAIKTQKSPYMKLEQWLVFSVIFRALMTQVSRRTIFQCTHTHTRTHTHTHTPGHTHTHTPGHTHTHTRTQKTTCFSIPRTIHTQCFSHLYFILQNCVARQVFGRMSSIVFLAFTLKLSNQTLLSVVRTHSVFLRTTQFQQNEHTPEFYKANLAPYIASISFCDKNFLLVILRRTLCFEKL